MKGWAFLAVGGMVLSGCTVETAKAKEEGRATRTSVELTVYSDDFAMVREKRPVSLAEGTNKVRVTDVSKQLDPSSVLFSWDKGSDAQVVASTYDLGVSDGNSLLKRYIGQPVDMVWYGENGEEGQKESGTLQVAGDGGMVLETGDKFIVNPNGTVIAPTRPDVVTIPQLTASVESKSKKDTDLGVAYLTRGLSWSADYVATLTPESNDMNLECWATVTNHTGATYPEAKINLVAGSPNRWTRTAGRVGMGEAPSSYPADTSLQFQISAGINLNRVNAPQAAGELYAYPVKAASTIAPEQMNRVRMLYSPKVTIKRDYSVRLPGYYEWYGNNTNAPQRQNAQMAINFTNSEKTGLGIPLPAGSVRVYEPDSSGSPRYVGASGINDTPNNGRASLALTNVFDITSEFRVLKTRKIGKRRIQIDYEALLKNAKTKGVDVRVVQGFSGAWKVVSESTKSTRPNGGTAQWMVRLPANGQRKLAYSVQMPG